MAARARRMTRPGEFILILAGKGNNGEDARQAMGFLADRPVELLRVTDPSASRGELGQRLNRRPALVIDGLFGIGLNRPLEEPWIGLIQAVNAARCPVLSVDVPSGLNAETGEIAGAAVVGTVTLTLGAAKRGLLQPAAWPYVNRLEVVPEIGLIPCPHQSETEWVTPEDFADFPPVRLAAEHKGDFGRVIIIAGSLGYHGASVLAAKGAQRAQPGLITLYTQAETYHPVAAQLAAVMVSVWQPQLKIAPATGAVLIGPGLAAERLPDEIKMAARQLWRLAPGAVVVDASALDWLPVGPLAGNLIRVITPHPGEAARLLRMSPQQVQANRPGALRDLSRLLGDCWVVLKGQQTLVGRSTGKILVNPSGNPQLAQGGSGDTLSGYLTGLLAQPALQTDVQKTIAYAVWQHGAAADVLSRRSRNWVVEDLLPELGNCGAGGAESGVDGI